MLKRLKTISIVLIKITFTLLIFYFIRKKITLNPLTYLNKNSIQYFLLAMVFSLFLIFLQTFRWQFIVKIFSIHLPYKQCLSAVWVGHMINNLFPAATAGDLLRSYTLRKVDSQQHKWKWLVAFLSEKYSSATSALVIACLSLVASISAQLPRMLIIFIILLSIASLITPFIVTKIISMLNLTKGKYNLSYLQAITRQLSNTFLNKDGRRAFVQSTLINLGMCIIFYIISTGLGAQIKFVQCLFVVPVFTLLTSLPISFAGWGIRELSCVGLLQFFGVSTQTAVVISVMYGIIFLLSCIPGIFISYSFFTSKPKVFSTQIV